MKRWVYVTVVATAMMFGVAACKKAHNAGNDSMRVGGGRIVASGGRAVDAGGMPGSGPSLPAASGARLSGESE